MRPSSRLLPGAFVAAVVIFLLAAPLWTGEPSVASKKADDRLDQLEREQKRIATQLREHDARLIHIEEMRGEMDEAVERLLPAGARWIPLRGGGGDQWDFNVGGRVQIQFLHIDDGGTPVFRMISRVGEADVPLKAGWAMRAVDDLGTERRLYTTTMHRLRTDRTGRPEAALLSVVVEVEGT